MHVYNRNFLSEKCEWMLSDFVKTCVCTMRLIAVTFHLISNIPHVLSIKGRVTFKLLENLGRS